MIFKQSTLNMVRLRLTGILGLVAFDGPSLRLGRAHGCGGQFSSIRSTGGSHRGLGARFEFYATLNKTLWRPKQCNLPQQLSPCEYSVACELVDSYGGFRGALLVLCCLAVVLVQHSIVHGPALIHRHSREKTIWNCHPQVLILLDQCTVVLNPLQI